MNRKELRELAAEIHVLNHKWWHDEYGVALIRNRGEMLMLVVSELAEAMEGLRKKLMDDKLTHRPMVEVEIADTFIRLLDYVHGNELSHLFDDYTTLAPPPMTFNEPESLFRIVGVVARVEWQPGNLITAIESCIRYCDVFGYDLMGAVREKLEYNKTRVDHTYEARKAAGGKGF